jgi:hypothetical protein
MAKRRTAKYHDRCYNAYRRHRYRTDPEYRATQIAHVQAYENTPQAQTMRYAAKLKRRRAGLVPWYQQRTHQISEDMRQLRRLYWRVGRAFRLGYVPPQYTKIARQVIKVMKENRRKPNPEAVREFLATVPREL